MYFQPVKKLNSVSGYSTLLAAPKSFFDTISTPPATGTTAGQTATVVVDHEFLALKGFLQIKTTTKGVQLKGKSSGESGAKRHDWDVTGEIAGLTAAQLEFLKDGVNDEWIILIKDGDCAANEYIGVGCNCQGAEMDYEFDSGTLKDGSKIIKTMFKAFCLPYKYQFTVDPLTTLLP